MLTPLAMFTNAWGIPVGVLKAGKSFSAICNAFSLNMTSPVRANRVRRPPTNRIFVSKTDNSDDYKKKEKKNEESFLGKKKFDNAIYHSSEIQVFLNPFPTLVELIHHSHNIESIETIDDRCSKISAAKNGRTVPLVTDGSQFVLTPRVCSIVIPCMLHHLNSIKKKKNNKSFPHFISCCNSIYGLWTANKIRSFTTRCVPPKIIRMKYTGIMSSSLTTAVV